MQVSFHLARILFALSALPFVLFEVPGLQTLLSHTHATGYNWRGECVRMVKVAVLVRQYLATTGSSDCS